jgi:hypothetical protein
MVSLERIEVGDDSSIVAVHTQQLAAGNNRLVELVDNTLVVNSIQKKIENWNY